MARTARAFHWPLEFPDVLQRGGFDVVLPPPWERIKLQEQEFFAARSPYIAGAPNKAAREKQIKALAAAPEGSPDRALFDDFQQAKRSAEAAREFARVLDEEKFTDKDRKEKTRFVDGRFPLTGRGDVNTCRLAPPAVPYSSICLASFMNGPVSSSPQTSDSANGPPS